MISKENLVDIATIVLASSFTIFGIIFSFVYSETQILMLIILTILLPIIYQVGNIISKEYVREENAVDYNALEDYNLALEEENSELEKYIDELEEVEVI